MLWYKVFRVVQLVEVLFIEQSSAKTLNPRVQTVEALYSTSYCGAGRDLENHGSFT